MEIMDLGVCSYQETLEKQLDVLERRINGGAEDTVIFVEHTPVVTFGRIMEDDSILDKDYFKRNNIPFVPTGRGGKVTYHAPGQLVMYPVISLSEKRKDISYFIDFLEKTVVRSLKQLGVPASRDPERRGVWVEKKKIAFIGIAVRKWVTYHGVAVNINNDITPFSYMNPCGENDITVTSAEACLGRGLDMAEVKKVFREQFTQDLLAEYDNAEEDANCMSRCRDGLEIV